MNKINLITEAGIAQEFIKSDLVDEASFEAFKDEFYILQDTDKNLFLHIDDYILTINKKGN